MMQPAPHDRSYTAFSLLIQPTTEDSYHQAAQVLGRAFINDPISLVVYPKFSTEKLVRALTVDFTAEEQVCVRRGSPIQVVYDGSVIGCAVVYPPGGYPLSRLDQWVLLLKSIAGNGLYNIRDWVRWLDEVDKLHPREPHYYLEYIGVEPKFQGLGVGSVLLNHLSELADKEQVGCYLENANPRNTPLYQRHGFQVIHVRHVIDVPTWFMWRPAGKT